jgi:hypothetical protein
MRPRARNDMARKGFAMQEKPKGAQGRPCALIAHPL